MPIYEYFCEECEYKFEQLLKFSDSEQVKCTNCGKDAKKIFSAFASKVNSDCGG